MELEISPNRPLARILVRAMSGRGPERTAPRRFYVPPAASSDAPRCAIADTGVAKACEQILRCLILGEPIADVLDVLDPDVVVWTPSQCAVSRAELMEILPQLELRGNTLTEVTLDVTDGDCRPERIFFEWRLTGRFSHPCFVDDDLLIAPSGRIVETAGAFSAILAQDRVVSIHCYYDDLALLEQFVTVS